MDKRRHLKLHRALGRVGAFMLIPAIVVIGFLMIRRMFHLSEVPPSLLDHLAFLDVNGLIDIPMFVGLVISNARNVQLHARRTSCSVLVMIPPALVCAMPMLSIFRQSFRQDLNIAMASMCITLLL